MTNNGLLITLKGKHMLSTCIHDDYTIDDVKVAFVSNPRTSDKHKFAMIVMIGEGSYSIPDHVIGVDTIVAYDDLHVEIYKVDCSSGTCEKRVLGQKYGDSE